MSVLESIPLDRIERQAREAHLGRLLLTLFVGVFWLAGWALRKAVMSVSFIGAAVKVGWRDAAGEREEPR